jgi:hypothetical protein
MKYTYIAVGQPDNYQNDPEDILLGLKWKQYNLAGMIGLKHYWKGGSDHFQMTCPIWLGIMVKSMTKNL